MDSAAGTWARRVAVLAALLTLRYLLRRRRAAAKAAARAQAVQNARQRHRAVEASPLAVDDAQPVATLLAHAGCEVDPSTGALTPPLHMASTFERDADLEYRRGFVYGRINNPTRDLLERTLAAAEGGERCCAFASGSAAAAAVFQALPGGFVLIPDDLYHGNRTMLTTVFADWGLQFTAVDMTDLAAVEDAIADAKSRCTNQHNVILWTETPSNPLLKITDLVAASELAARHNVPHVVDATWLTPALCRPLGLGCDLVLHSTTKYLGGHSDLIGGAVVCGGTRIGGALFDRVQAVQRSCGAVPSPFDCWLTLRGMRSLGARMRLHSRNALLVARFLRDHPSVEAVYYPGLETHQGHNVAAKQMESGFGGMLSFLVHGGEAAAVQVCAATKVAKRGTSLGGTESLVEHRASIEPKTTATPRNLIRMSIGLESAADIINDLDQALQAASA